jgi:hypothetical protein
MSLRLRRMSAQPAETTEPESDYIAMTDMMVGVLFIFIIMLCFFALQYKKTTVSLTSAKDAQTTALLQTANALSPEAVQAEIDRQAHVVCLPGTLFGDTGAGETRRCFAYTGDKPAPAASADRKSQIAAADRAALMAAIDSDMRGSSVPTTMRPSLCRRTACSPPTAPHSRPRDWQPYRRSPEALKRSCHAMPKVQLQPAIAPMLHT